MLTVEVSSANYGIGDTWWSVRWHTSTSYLLRTHNKLDRGFNAYRSNRKLYGIHKSDAKTTLSKHALPDAFTVGLHSWPKNPHMGVSSGGLARTPHDTGPVTFTRCQPHKRFGDNMNYIHQTQMIDAILVYIADHTSEIRPHCYTLGTVYYRPPNTETDAVHTVIWTAITIGLRWEEWPL